MAKKTTKQSNAKPLSVIIGIVFFMTFVWFGLQLRDYNMVQVGNQIRFIAKIAVPTCSSVSIDNSKPRKIIVTSTSLASADGYEFRISRFSNMAFGRISSSSVARKEFSMLSGGSIYYVQIRAYVRNSAGRHIHGAWCYQKPVVVKEK